MFAYMVLSQSRTFSYFVEESDYSGRTYHNAHKRSICPWCTQKAGSPGEVNRSPPGSPLRERQYADIDFSMVVDELT